MEQNPFLKQGLRLFSPGGRFGKLQILLYHRVLKQPDPFRPWEVDRQLFTEQMQLLANYYQVLSLPDAMRKLALGKLPAQAVCITFDDGYEDNVTVALPILQRFNLPATFFIATKFLDGSLMWNDQIIESIRQYTGAFVDLSEFGLEHYPTKTFEQKTQTIPRILQAAKHQPDEKRQQIVSTLMRIARAKFEPQMLNPNGIKTLAQAGMEIGAHTVSHPILKSVSMQEAEYEIQKSKETLESILQKPIRYFAYPNGFPGRDYGIEHTRMLKRFGFQNGFATWWGAADAHMDPYQLPRFTPWDKSPLRFMLRLTQYRYNIKGQPILEG